MNARPSRGPRWRLHPQGIFSPVWWVGVALLLAGTVLGIASGWERSEGLIVVGLAVVAASDWKRPSRAVPAAAVGVVAVLAAARVAGWVSSDAMWLPTLAIVLGLAWLNSREPHPG